MNFEKSDGLNRSMDLLVRHMWRSAAVINMLCREIRSPGLRPPEKSVIIRIVQYLCCAPIVCFHSEVMDCLVAVLQWILVIDPSLRSIVSVEISAMFLDTAKRRLGMFSSQVGRTEEEDEDEVEENDRKSLLTAGSYSSRLKDFVRHPKAARDKGSTERSVNSTSPCFKYCTCVTHNILTAGDFSSFSYAVRIWGLLFSSLLLYSSLLLFFSSLLFFSTFPLFITASYFISSYIILTYYFV